MKYLKIIEAYEKYFSDIYVTRRSFYGSIFKPGNEKIKKYKIGSFWKIREIDIHRYFKKQRIAEIRKERYLAILDDVSINGKLSDAGRLLGVNPVMMYEVVNNNRLGPTMLRRIKKNITELKKLAS